MNRCGWVGFTSLLVMLLSGGALALGIFSGAAQIIVGYIFNLSLLATAIMMFFAAHRHEARKDDDER